MFTKRHFVMLAAAIAESKNLENFTEKLISYFQCDNERFSETRFRAYIAKLKGHD